MKRRYPIALLCSVLLFCVNKSIGQVYTSGTAIQNETPTAAGRLNQVVLKIAVDASGSGSAMSVDSFVFTTAGSSTSAGLITDAKLYFTGTTDKFGSSNQFGTTVIAPGDTFTVADSELLTSGTNYFWLTYSVDSAAQLGDSLDAALIALTVGGIVRNPVISAPAGNKKIGVLYDFEIPNDLRFHTVSYDLLTTQFAKGIPTNSVDITNAAFSGDKVWKTNLNGPYDNNRDYALKSPVYVATETTVRLAFMEAMKLQVCCDQASVEYRINNGVFNPLATYASFMPNWEMREGLYVIANPGDTVQFQWHFKSDSLVTFDGWMIDDVIISGAQEVLMSSMPFKGPEENEVSLPVKLSSFIATRSEKTALLKWTTASEVNSSHFVIERSTDMRVFTAIGQVKAKGNSNSAVTYIYNDEQASKAAGKGTVYYRLRAVDFDNTSEVSGLKAVSFYEALSTAMSVYPNPFVQGLNMQVSSESDAVMSIEITDLQGRTLIDEHIVILPGTNNVAVDKAAILSQGVYMMRTQLNGVVSNHKLIKTN